MGWFKGLGFRFDCSGFRASGLGLRLQDLTSAHLGVHGVEGFVRGVSDISHFAAVDSRQDRVREREATGKRE